MMTYLKIALIYFFIFLSLSNIASAGFFSDLDKALNSIFGSSQNTSYENQESTYEDSKPTKLYQKKDHKYYRLTIYVNPVSSSIKIMNIRPKYHDGIRLSSGKYDILVEKEGYKSYRKMITIYNQDIERDIVLEQIVVAQEAENRIGLESKHDFEDLNKIIEVVEKETIVKQSKSKIIKNNGLFSPSLEPVVIEPLVIEPTMIKSTISPTTINQTAMEDNSFSKDNAIMNTVDISCYIANIKNISKIIKTASMDNSKQTIDVYEKKDIFIIKDSANVTIKTVNYPLENNQAHLKPDLSSDDNTVAYTTKFSNYIFTIKRSINRIKGK
jgi:hypothetical protein